MEYDFESLIGGNSEVIKSILVALGGLLLIIGIITLVILILMIIATCKFYKKAGKSGWETIVPFYCNWVLVEIAGLNWWWFLLLISSWIVSLFVIIILLKNYTEIGICCFDDYISSNYDTYYCI